jgi:hypothetical protein
MGTKEYGSSRENPRRDKPVFVVDDEAERMNPVRQSPRTRVERDQHGLKRTRTVGRTRNPGDQFEINYRDVLLTVTDDQVAAKTRVELGQLGAGLTDYGIKVYDDSGNTLFDVSGSSGLLSSPSGDFVISLTSALLTVKDDQGTPETRVELGDFGGGIEDYGLKIYDEDGLEFVIMTQSRSFIRSMGQTPGSGIQFCFAAKVTGESWDRFAVTQEGTVLMGDGTSFPQEVIIKRGGTDTLRLANDDSNRLKVDIEMLTEDLVLIDAGSTGATEQDWIEVTVGGNQGYIRVFSAK